MYYNHMQDIRLSPTLMRAEVYLLRSLHHLFKGFPHTTLDVCYLYLAKTHQLILGLHSLLPVV